MVPVRWLDVIERPRERIGTSDTVTCFVEPRDPLSTTRYRAKPFRTPLLIRRC